MRQSRAPLFPVDLFKLRGFGHELDRNFFQPVRSRRVRACSGEACTGLRQFAEKLDNFRHHGR